MAAEADAAAGIDGSPIDDGPDDLLADFALEAPGEAKYRTLEQMSKDIKGLDEVGGEGERGSYEQGKR